MIWYIGLLICALIAFWLAVRSMRDFQDEPRSFKDTQYGLFLIRNTSNLSQSIFNSLLNELKGLIVSFEHIQKGNSTVLVSFLPNWIVSKFPSLGLVEIEDYLESKDHPSPDEFIRSRQISLNDSFAWNLQPKRKNQPVLEKSGHLRFDLKSDQYLAIQVVTQPSEQGVQLNIRLLVKDQTPQAKVELIKTVKQKIDQKTSLTSNPTLLHPAVFEDFQKRASVPRHSQAFIVSEGELLEFIKN